jgi:hypothetical protein
MHLPFALLQATTELPARLSALEAAAKSAQSAGDNAWMLTSAALVLMMTGPGLALFYGGLVRRKNVLSSMMHSFGQLHPGRTIEIERRFAMAHLEVQASMMWPRLPVA